MRTRRSRDERGAAAVEFALVLIPVVVILFGLVQYGLYFYSAQTGSNTVNAAVRQLAVGNCQSSSALQNYVDNQLGAASTDTDATVTTEFFTPAALPVSVGPVITTDALGGTVKLTIKFHSMNMHFPLVPFLSESWVDRRAQARIEDTSDEGCGS
jgi:Flp pilus assembly protein TadG